MKPQVAALPRSRSRQLYALMQARALEAEHLSFEGCLALMEETRFCYGPGETSDLGVCGWIEADGFGGWFLRNG